MSNAKAVTCLMRQVRSFSTSNTNLQLAKAPIQLFGLEGRYAHAIYSAAVKQNQLDVVDKDFQGVKKFFNDNAGLKDLLKNPTLTKEEKANAVKVLSGPKPSAVTTNALSLLAENGRLGRLFGVVRAFDMILNAHRGDVTATVTTAKPLDASQLKDLQAVLGNFLQKGRKLMLVTKVNPSILGGMVVEIGDRYVDMSVSSKVNAYTNLIKESL